MTESFLWPTILHDKTHSNGVCTYGTILGANNGEDRYLMLEAKLCSSYEARKDWRKDMHNSKLRSKVTLMLPVCLGMLLNFSTGFFTRGRGM